MSELLAVDSLHSGYGQGDILQGVTITVAPGEVLAVVGRNGVGKTTLMKTIMGLLALRKGRIRFDGEDIGRQPVEVRAELGIGYVPQGKQIFRDLSVRENLMMGERLNRGRSVDYDLVFDYFPILKERLSQRGGTLSGGQQQALAIGRALVGGPRVLLLDEPTESIQPNIIQQLGDILRRLNEEAGLTIVLVEQNIGLIEAAAGRGYVMDKGRVVTELSRDDMRRRETMLEHLTV